MTVADLRLEYRGFRNTDVHREYLIKALLAEEEREYVLLIEHAAFADKRVSLQDGPDLCFQRLRRELVDGTLRPLPPLAISPEEMASYRASHAPVGRRLSVTPARPGPETKTASDASDAPAGPPTTEGGIP